MQLPEKLQRSVKDYTPTEERIRIKPQQLSLNGSLENISDDQGDGIFETPKN